MSRFGITSIAAAIAFLFGTGATAAPESLPDDEGVEVTVLEEAALDLALNNGCFTCHAVDKKIIGPAWIDVSARYRSEANAEDELVKKVSSGGKGVWGKDLVMPPFAPHMKEANIRTLVKYILSLR